MSQKIYPRSNDKETVYLKSVITNPNIIVGDYTIYNDFAGEPKNFEKNNVLYQYPVNCDKLLIGKFCSIALQRHGIIKGILLSETMSGLAMKQSF